MCPGNIFRNGIGLILLLLSMTAFGQTCNSRAIAVAPDSRYMDNLDGTILDLDTGLMWQKCIVGLSGSDCTVGTASSYDWGAALLYAQELNASGGYAGYGDWRLANIKETASLMETKCAYPTINLTFFPNTPAGTIWSSTPVVNSTTNAWTATFSSSYTSSASKLNGYSIRLVRTAY